MPRMTAQTQAILAALLEEPTGDHYGLELTRQAGLPSGTVYPILARLEQDGWLESDWEKADPSKEGRPRRRYYRLTAHGATMASRELASTLARLQRVRALTPRPASA